MTYEKGPLPSLEEVLRQINSLADFASKPAKSASDRGAFEDYPLHKVAIWGDVVAAKVLLSHGADVNALGEDDDTPLHRAFMAKVNMAEMVKLLLSCGANPDIRNRYRDSPRDEALRLNDPEIIRAMELGRPKH
ncbi:MAG TPA: ankyrin repeat domain-containing protein [Stellaceae bacterium]|nr:ankyrin repeat domain-containing protein [Stellaceae bacterium]